MTAIPTTRARKGASSNDVRRAGALAAIVALHALIEAANDPCGDDAGDYFTKQHSDAQAVVTSLGPMPPYLEGAITALAEYCHCLETTGEPNLEMWRPVSAMTRAELQNEIADMEKAHAQDLPTLGTIGDHAAMKGGAM